MCAYLATKLAGNASVEERLPSNIHDIIYYSACDPAPEALQSDLGQAAIETENVLRSLTMQWLAKRCGSARYFCAFVNGLDKRLRQAIMRMQSANKADRSAFSELAQPEQLSNFMATWSTSTTNRYIIAIDRFDALTESTLNKLFLFTDEVFGNGALSLLSSPIGLKPGGFVEGSPNIFVFNINTEYNGT
jgi:hypothetical protein